MFYGQHNLPYAVPVARKTCIIGQFTEDLLPNFNTFVLKPAYNASLGGMCLNKFAVPKFLRHRYSEGLKENPVGPGELFQKHAFAPLRG